MKLTYAIALLVGAVSAHTIGQKLSVNGVEQAQIAGIRAPRLNDVRYCQIIPESIADKLATIARVQQSATKHRCYRVQRELAPFVDRDRRAFWSSDRHVVVGMVEGYVGKR
jgi:hypothetical protein